MATFVARLHELPTDSLDALVAESEEAGSRVVRGLVEEWHTGANRFDRPGEALFGLWVDGRLVGVCGLNVDPYRGGDGTGRVRHLYVLSGFRRRGMGRRLVTRIIVAARGRFDTLRLRTANPSAARLYESLGFRSSGGPDGSSTHVMELAPARPTSPGRGPDPRDTRISAPGRKG